MKNEYETMLLRVTYQNEEDISNLIQYGNTISGKGNLRIPENNTIPNTFNYKNYLKSQNISKLIDTYEIKKEKDNNVLSKMRQKIRDTIENQRNSNYLMKLLLGINEDIDYEIQSAYQKNGITHIFVISGMHLAILYEIFHKLVKKVTKKEFIQHIIPFLGLALYYSLISSSISSKRAFYFYGLSCLNNIGKFNFKTKQIFLFTIGIILLENPYAIYQIGFQYSFLLAFSFLIFKPKGKRKYQKIFKSSLLAFLVSLPITVNHSFEINPWSIIINCITIPFLTSIIFPGLLLSLFLHPLQYILEVLLQSFETMNLFATSLPFSSITMSKMPLIMFLFYYIFLYCYFKLKKKHFLVILCLELFLWNMAPIFDSNAYIFFLDVGEGDSALIISPKRKEVILIDTGKESKWLSKNIILFLKSQGIRNLDYLILSHGDNDHAGNTLEILENINVKNIVLNEGSKNELEKKITQNYPDKIKEKINTSSIKITNLNHEIVENENDDSRVLHLCVYQTCTLFTGDITKDIEEEILKKYNFRVSILKVGHHGSKTSSSEEFINGIKPKYSIISVGKNNRYGHPNKEVLDNLKDSKIYRTDKDGSIMFKINNKGLKIATSQP